MVERYTIQKYNFMGKSQHEDSFIYWAEMAGPTTGQGTTEAGAVEKLAENLESIVAAIRGGEIWFKREGELREEPHEETPT
jgi:hypothetical protein